MRLGGHQIFLEKNTILYEAYKKEKIIERFRHRFHIIPKYIDNIKSSPKMIISAYDKNRRIVNAIELEGHPFCVGVQFHPEYKSRFDRPSPIYNLFIKKVLEYHKKKSILK